MKQLLGLVCAGLCLLCFQPEAFARIQIEDPTCENRCSAAEEAQGCKDYRRPDNTCYRVIGGSVNVSPTPTVSPSPSGTRLFLSVLDSSNNSIRLRGILTVDGAREEGATVQCRRGTAGARSKRKWGRERVTGTRGIFTIAGPQDATSPCYDCTSGTIRSNEVCLN